MMSQAKSIYFHKGINIINKNIIKEDIKYFLEPIITVNGTSMIKCFKVDVLINNRVIKDVIFGISNEYFNLDVDVILNSEIGDELSDQLD